MIAAALLALTLAAGAQPLPGDRLVVLGGALTETVAALGGAERVAAVDASSVYPPEAVAGRPSVGFYRQVSAEGVLSLAPSAVLASEAAGPPAALAQLEAAGVPVLRLTDAATLEGCLARIRGVGQALGAEARAEALAAEVEARTHAAAAVARQGEAPAVLFVYARGAGTLLVAGEGTSADEIIRLSGGRNAAAGFEGFKPLTPEAAVAAAPEVVLMTTDGVDTIGGSAAIWGLPGLALTPAGRAHRLVLVETGLLLGFGPRLPEAIETLGAALDEVAR